MTERQNQADDILIEAKDLKKWFPVQSGFLERLMTGRTEYVRAVDGVSFAIRRGEVLGLAGESGSGKTTVGRLVIRLEEPTAGTVRFEDLNLSELSTKEIRRLRRRMQVIFQDPMASLNPRMTIGEAVKHPLEIHFPDQKSEHRRMITSILEKVGLTPPDFFYNKYPHQISGGQRQRVVIARAS